MKRLLLILVLALMLAGCRKTNDEDCKLNWRAMPADTIEFFGVGTIASKLLNEKHLPGTVGEYLQQCLEEGWRPAGL